MANAGALGTCHNTLVSKTLMSTFYRDRRTSFRQRIASGRHALRSCELSFCLVASRKQHLRKYQTAYRARAPSRSSLNERTFSCQHESTDRTMFGEFIVVGGTSCELTNTRNWHNVLERRFRATATLRSSTIATFPKTMLRTTRMPLLDRQP